MVGWQEKKVLSKVPEQQGGIRQNVDQQLGIIPGATKFGYNLGVDMKSAAGESGNGNVNPTTFAKTYANSLMGN